MTSAAFFSADRRYRYWLTRIWDESLPMFCSIGINPSIAAEEINDPTVRKDMGFGRRLGFGGLLKLNVGAYCCTDPKKWRRALDPFGVHNAAEDLRAYADRFKVGTVVLSWGCNGAYCPTRCAAIADIFPDAQCWGENPDGTPRHPLMLPYTTQLERFRKVERENQ